MHELAGWPTLGDSAEHLYFLRMSRPPHVTCGRQVCFHWPSQIAPFLAPLRLGPQRVPRTRSRSAHSSLLMDTAPARARKNKAKEERPSPILPWTSWLILDSTMQGVGEARWMEEASTRTAAGRHVRAASQWRREAATIRKRAAAAVRCGGLPAAGGRAGFVMAVSNAPRVGRGA